MSAHLFPLHELRSSGIWPGYGHPWYYHIHMIYSFRMITRRSFSCSNNDCLQLCPGRWASPGAGLPSGHSFGWYEVWDLFQSGITGRVSEEVLEWNCQSTLVLRVFCHTLYIWTGILHNLCWTILQRFNCCLPSDSKFTNLFWSCFVCLSILNLKSFSKIIATSFYIEGLSRELCLASLNSFSFLSSG